MQVIDKLLHAPPDLVADKRTRVIVPDLRGGEGATDAPAGRYDLSTMRGDLVALMDALDLERTSICLQHPERVKKYVAIAVPPPDLRMSP